MVSKKLRKKLVGSSKWIVLTIVLSACILYFNYLFLLLLLLTTFLYKFWSVRMGIDYLGLDPFFFSSFYVGYAYGTKTGIIFGFLFGLAFIASQKGYNIRTFYLIIVFTIIGTLSSFTIFMSPVTAGFIMVYFGAFLDIVLLLFFFGPNPRIFLIHLGHGILAFILITKVLPFMPGI